MNKITKAIIAGAVIVGIGIAILLVTGFATGWKFGDSANWEMKTYECDTHVDDIKLDFSADSLTVQFYDGDKIKVEYPESKRVTMQFNVAAQTLKISSVVRFHVNFLWFNKIPTTKMYIPRDWKLNYNIEVNAGALYFSDGGSYGNVKIRLSAGAIDLTNVTCSDFKLDMSAGAINIGNLTCNKFVSDISAGSLNVKGLQCGDIDLDLSAGSAKIKVVGYKYDYTILTNISAGSCNVGSQSGGNKRLTVDVSAGSVTVDFD